MNFRLICLASAVILVLPLDVRSSQLSSTGVRLVANDALCQATSCMSWTGRICSMEDADWMDFKCSGGCPVTEE